ncbi:DUF4007 family protein [Mucilaginibacter ginsenosidivorans]|uniref:DUF4007 family protein n=1 Tax=Mucilaginibacter ginsenosidivorans TaxID=398053 RepID=A0A5B8USJ5_9SPHI|nr:DUF4007 family protein [Mucilaginibacter ginsenosidivorans]QEC61974.1 DUF4007 family protein [Mucilaginibacter ginsenosidivorans]
MEVLDKQSVKYTFSGHDTFQCRQLWLKKGYEFVKENKSFNNESAVVDLGVGKNMVSAINYWLKAFDLLDKDGQPTTIAEYLLDDNGKDPYLEDEASLWLLHYHLVKKGLASTYSLIFNELRREKIEFTKDNFIAFVNRKAESLGFVNINMKTVATDFDIFVKMYKLTNSQGKDIEDTFSGLLTELNLLKFDVRKSDEKTETYYYIDNAERVEIPDEVVLYAIINSGGFDKSINLSAIEQNPDNAGSIFALNRTGLVNKLESIASSKKFKEYGITYTDHAGIKELQFKSIPNPFDILNKYYGI